MSKGKLIVECVFEFLECSIFGDHVVRDIILFNLPMETFVTEGEARLGVTTAAVRGANMAIARSENLDEPDQDIRSSLVVKFIDKYEELHSSVEYEELRDFPGSAEELRSVMESFAKRKSFYVEGEVNLNMHRLETEYKKEMKRVKVLKAQLPELKEREAVMSLVTECVAHIREIVRGFFNDVVQILNINDTLSQKGSIGCVLSVNRERVTDILGNGQSKNRCPCAIYQLLREEFRTATVVTVISSVTELLSMKSVSKQAHVSEILRVSSDWECGGTTQLVTAETILTAMLVAGYPDTEVSERQIIMAELRRLSTLSTEQETTERGILVGMADFLQKRINAESAATLVAQLSGSSTSKSAAGKGSGSGKGVQFVPGYETAMTATERATSLEKEVASLREAFESANYVQQKGRSGGSGGTGGGGGTSTISAATAARLAKWKTMTFYPVAGRTGLHCSIVGAPFKGVVSADKGVIVKQVETDGTESMYGYSSTATKCQPCAHSPHCFSYREGLGSCKKCKMFGHGSAMCLQA